MYDVISFLSLNRIYSSFHGLHWEVIKRILLDWQEHVIAVSEVILSVFNCFEVFERSTLVSIVGPHKAVNHSLPKVDLMDLSDLMDVGDGGSNNSGDCSKFHLYDVLNWFINEKFEILIYTKKVDLVKIDDKILEH